MTKINKLKEKPPNAFVIECRQVILNKMMDTAELYKQRRWPKLLYVLQELGKMSQLLKQ